MEALLGVVLEQVEGSEDVLIQMLEERFHEGLEGSSWAVHLVEDLAESWRQSQLGKEMERLIPRTGDGETEAEVEREQELYKSNLRQTTRYRILPAQLGETVNSPARGVTSQKPIRPMNAFKALETEGPHSPYHELTTLPDHSVALIESYFIVVHSWFPIVERHHVYRTYYQYAKGQEVPSQGCFSCLLAILAAAEVRRAFQAASEDSDSVRTALELLHTALESIPNQYQAVELGHVQALLILSLAYVDMGRPEEAWVIVGRAAQALQLAGERLQKDKDKFTHVFRGYQMLDCILATKLRLMPYLWHGPLSNMGKVEEDGMEEWASVDGIFYCRTKHPGPMLALSTFNQLGDAAHELAEVFATDQSPGDRSDGKVVDSNGPADTGSRRRQHNGSFDVLTPQRLTLYLLRLTKDLVRSRQDDDQKVSASRIRELSQTYTTNIDMYQPHAIPALIQVLWTIIIDHAERFQATERTSALQGIRTALLATPGSPILSMAKQKLSHALSNRQRTAVEPSMIPLTPMTSKNSQADIVPRPVVDLMLTKRMPAVAGLGIQDVDFSLMPELEDESGVPDQTLDQIMAQLQGTTVVPTASAPISPEMGSNLGASSLNSNSQAQAEGYTDPFSWDNECENSLQNLGFPILDDRGTTIHPLLNLPALPR
ncbi:hypothetical protein M409DRAFT_29573 [Zasmidium cellare ATCC 36951]|uniref:Xylanolytic transcriptional activator regulatory domain-containing protein n=1 Tax=Zasmidium cellare ATCC 36951 TaxID=1080233 RepID=A0A6A6BZD2_ZASCE|nr:uncharacterized protein M409DRAFT_29573 [Zasmidium cellare ATCC 36951]KAF2159963.1 hypothetical protein M409DRAFT_29573 [Zasmidium cellare ATCC 36951]